MSFLKIGKSDLRESNKLQRIHKSLLERGERVSSVDKPSTFCEATEMTIAAVFEGIPDLVCDSFKVLENPPSTWNHYLAMHDGKKIYEMEFGELREAVKRDLKTGKAELHVQKEMTHVLAAAIYMSLIDDD